MSAQSLLPLIAILYLNPVALHGQAGALNPNFGTDGIVITPIGQSLDLATDIAILPDGSILAAGYSFFSTTASDFSMVKYHSDGNIDESFGDNGKVTLDFLGGQDYCYSIVVQNNGQIVLSGSASAESGAMSYYVLARLEADGSLDESFGVIGQAFANMSGGLDSGTAALLQDDGKILLGGTNRNLDNSVQSVAILRFDSNGTWEANFGTNGIAENDKVRSCTAIGLQSDGRIVSNGSFINDTVMTPEALEFAVLRFTDDGMIDSTFGTNGLRSINVGELDQAIDLYVQSDDKILLTGTSLIDDEVKSSILRLTPDGQLDPSFAGNGIYTFDFGNTLTVCWSLQQQPDGTIIATGRTSNLNSEDPIQLFVLRLLENGQPDPTFGENGVVVLNADPNAETEGRALVADLTTITVAGVQFDTDSTDPNYFLAQFYASENVGTSTNPLLISEADLYPNPLVDQFTLTYSLKEPAQITVELYDLKGTLIKPLLQRQKRPTGHHQEALRLDADFPCGSYFILLRTDNTAQPGRLLMLHKS